MFTGTRVAALCLVAFATGFPSLAASTTRTFQQGQAGYAGAKDTWVSRLDWDTPKQYSVNYGKSTMLRLSRDGGDNPLVLFDLSSIPANSAVVSATLELRNTTVSNPGGTPAVRQIDLFRVLKSWDEGNQVSSPIDATGKRGATGDFAFAYFPGEGTNVPWAGRGMTAGSDYDAAPAATQQVGDPGWYGWDVTPLVRAWVRGEALNAGVTLRDRTGYVDGNLDWRDFVSSEGADPTLRPKLTVVYDPDTPLASAGPDQENLTWSGGLVTLDGSGSHDRPGGSDATLTFSWKVVTAGYGSALSGAVLGTSKVQTLTPDTAGEWEIELTVTNDVGSSATDRVRLRLLSLSSSHPRIFLTPARLAALQARAVTGNPRWDALVDEVGDPSSDMQAKALVSQVTGAPAPCDAAITQLLQMAAANPSWATAAGDMAVVFDWCYGRLTPAQKSTLVTYFNAWGDNRAGHANDAPGLVNYWPRWGYSYGMVGLATWGDNPRAREWMDEFRLTRFRDVDRPLLDLIADGGGWPEGTVYDWIANPSRVEVVEGWRTATGEDLFASTAWFANRIPYFLLHRAPGLADQFGYAYHPYVSIGDGERNRGSIANYERIMALILLGRFGSSTYAPQLAAYLSTPPTDGSMDFQAHKEFLWFEPDRPAGPPSLLTHLSRATGSIFMRAGWPTGAADTSADVTYATFQCGNFFTYHQHLDQNSFTLTKGGDLLVDSGVYSGDGLSYHDVNYYIRTIAHNTLVVFNPSEDFTSARSDAESIDGGQRTMSPATRSPGSVEYIDQHAVHYETGDLTRFSDAPTHTYALGDATRAYNSPAYSQSSDTGYAGNVPKVSRFQREFAYLRPTSTGGDDYLVLLDRVGVTQAAFSGSATKLLFHTLGEPVVNGTPSTVSPGETLYTGSDLAVADRGTARAFIRTLAPEGRRFRKVGGRGVKAFWVNGKSYDWHWSDTEPQPRPINDFEEEPYGEWRLELEPGDTALEHTFLTVIQPATTARATMVPAALLSAGSLVGVHLADAARDRVALFSSAADGTPPSGTLTYSFQPTATTRHLVADLVPGTRYDPSVAAAGATQTVTLAPSASGALAADTGGVLTFETVPGASADVLVIDDQPGDGRFRVTLDWSTVQGGGRSGHAHPLSTIPVGVTTGGLFWFFSAGNPEVLVKVLNGCAVNGKFWAFASAGTNVAYTLKITDTRSGAGKSYQNPDLTPAAPVQDVAAFGCP